MSAGELMVQDVASRLPAVQPARADLPLRGQYLTFTLGDDVYALGILSVKEIIEYTTITSVPMVASCVRGIINLRGAVVPVMDMQARFGRMPTEIGRRSCIVIVEVQDADGAQVIGVIVDAVNEVLEISADEIEPPPSLGGGLRTEFIRGMARVRDHFMIVLDIDRVFNPDDIAQTDCLMVV